MLSHIHAIKSQDLLSSSETFTKISYMKHEEFTAVIARFTIFRHPCLGGKRFRRFGELNFLFIVEMTEVNYRYQTES